jgi:hypothetical protein
MSSSSAMGRTISEGGDGIGFEISNGNVNPPGIGDTVVEDCMVDGGSEGT